MKKIKLKKRLSSSIIFFWVIIFSILIAIALVIRIGKVITESLKNYAIVEVRKLTVEIINESINEDILNDADMNNLFIVNKDEFGKVKQIDFNPMVVNRILDKATTKVRDNLILLENGKLESFEFSSLINPDNFILRKNAIIFEVPIGSITKNSIFANMGPKIPIKLQYSGDVLGNIDTKIEEYGINNALFKSAITIEITSEIVMPFLTETIKINTSIPISIKLLQGEIPNYYYGNLS